MSVLTIALNKFFKKHVFPLVLCSTLIVLKIQNHKIHSFVKTIFFSRLSAFALKLHFFPTVGCKFVSLSSCPFGSDEGCTCYMKTQSAWFY